MVAALATDRLLDVRFRLPAGIGRKTEEEHKANTWGQQVHGVSFKKRAPRAIKEIRGFAEKAMVCGFLSRGTFVSSQLLQILYATAC